MLMETPYPILLINTCLGQELVQIVGLRWKIFSFLFFFYVCMFFWPLFGLFFAFRKNVFWQNHHFRGLKSKFYFLARVLLLKKCLSIKRTLIWKNKPKFVIFDHFGPFSRLLIFRGIAGWVRKPRGWSQISCNGSNLSRTKK